MPSVGRYDNPTINVDWYPEELPDGAEVQPLVLPTPDRASTSGNLYLPRGGARRLDPCARRGRRPRLRAPRHRHLGRMRAAVLIMAGLLAACGTPAVDDPEAITVTVEVVEADAPVSVSVTDLIRQDGLLRHAVRVTWEGDGPAVLDDARFTHRVSGDDGVLLVAGRGCGWNWFDDMEELAGVCTDDLQIIEVAPGGSHEYPVAIHPEVGPARLGPGTYVVEEPVAWALRDEEQEFPDPPGVDPDGVFTIRLVYDVRP
jgi:hypothetical protein